jgi:fatty acid desaturase
VAAGDDRDARARRLEDATATNVGGGGRDGKAEADEDGEEDYKERIDRELIELLNELRVALPGIQILFAFLLVVPFSNRFGGITGPQRDVYMLSFLCAAAAATLLIAPSAMHRILFRQKEKERIILTSNRLAIAATIFLAVAITGVIFLVTDVVLGTLAATLLSIAAGLWTTWLWFFLPLMRLFEGHRRDRRQRPPAE